MFPVDSMTGAPWSADNSSMALQEIRATCVADLRNRDERNGIKRANGWKVYDDPEPDPGTPARYVINPVLAGLKHTAAESKALLRGRWAEFCEQPRDEKTLSAKYRGTTRAQKIAQYIEDGREVTESLQDAISLDKRGRGRPKGSKNKPAAVELEEA